jgi:DNA-binding LacI/PurR family transcriptional regulator
MPDYVGRLRAERFPFVIIDHDDDAPGCDVIAADNLGGARQAVTHLVELGHRRIAIITGDPVAGSSHQRVLGYREALATGGLPFDESLIVQGDFLEPRAHLATLQLMRLSEPPTAIFASSDLAAFGVMRAARELGLRVPEDLSVVGFDDIPEASYVGPPLTTVLQPLREMGRAGVRRLAELVRDPVEASMRMTLATTLMVRGTTAPPPDPLPTRRRTRDRS